MREIKFRLWCENKKEWEKGEWVICPNGTLIEVKFNNRINLRKDTHLLSQYTGSKDKNGVEIFEGDILKWEEMDNHNENIDFVKYASVYYSDGCFNVDFMKTYSENLNAYNEFCEVIGNVYQNKNLLEVE